MQLLFTLAQGCLCLFAIRNISLNANEMSQVPCFVKDRLKLPSFRFDVLNDCFDLVRRAIAYAFKT